MATNVRLLKIPSITLRNSKFNYDVSYDQALLDGNLIAMGNSQLVQWIYAKRGIDSNTLGEYVAQLRKQGEYKKATETLYMTEVLKVDFSKPDDMDKIVKNGLIVNGQEYVFLLTKGDEDVTFIRKDLKEEMDLRLNADRDMEQLLYGAKLNAYKALTTTGSTKVTSPTNVIVIKDCDKSFEADYLWVDEDVIPKKEVVKRNINDGAGFISPQLAKTWTEELGHSGIDSAFQVRYLWTKGILYPFDYKRWITENGGKTTVVDVWGHERNILDADIILTESMVKLSKDHYKSMEDWLTSADKYEYVWRVGKTSKKIKVGYSNYQQILPLNMCKDDCKDFIQYEIDYLKDVMGGDWRSTYLYLNGVENTETGIAQKVKHVIENGGGDLSLALMIEPSLAKDKFTQVKVRANLQGTKTDMKNGHCMLGEDSSFQIIVPDPIALVQHLSGLEPVGFLNPYEIYSKTHMDKEVEEVLAFRSPQLIENNIVRVKIARPGEDVQKYLEYLDDVYIVDSCSLINESMCGLNHSSR